MTDMLPADKSPLSDNALDQLFRTARTYNRFTDKPVPNALLQAIYDLMKWGATSANCQPARILFLTSNEAKARLKPFLDDGNIKKTMAAPVTALIGHDLAFYEHLPEQYPAADAKSWFVGDNQKIAETAFRNGTLQGAYFMLAARALGLDCGPMSGFNIEGASKEFFKDSKVQANFLCNLGYGAEDGTYPRGPRLSFDQACQIL